LKRNEKYKGFGFVVSLGTGLSRPPTDGETHPLFSSELIYLRPIWGLPRVISPSCIGHYPSGITPHSVNMPARL